MRENEPMKMVGAHNDPQNAPLHQIKAAMHLAEAGRAASPSRAGKELRNAGQARHKGGMGE